MLSRNFYFYWLPVYLYLGLIFYLSHQPASMLPRFKFDKLIHFSEYALLGLLLMRALAKSYRRSNILLLRFIALFIAVTYAGTDEFHQRFIFGRNSDFFDWLTDSFGAAAGSFLFFGMGKYTLTGTSKTLSQPLKLAKSLGRRPVFCRRSDRPEGRGLPSDKPEGNGAASYSRSHRQSHKP